MKVDAQLLERYHLNQCSPEEEQLVEEWLLNTDAAPLVMHSVNRKEQIKADIWRDISSILPPEKETPAVIIPKVKPSIYYFWKGAIAATLLLGLLGVIAFYMLKPGPQPGQLVAFQNNSSYKVNHISSSSYNLAIGPETSAQIDQESGAIDLSGSMLISPKKDMDLHFEGAAEKMTLKKGQTYIILNSKNGQLGLIVINEKNIVNLPTVIQRKIIRQFDI